MEEDIWADVTTQSTPVLKIYKEDIGMEAEWEALLKELRAFPKHQVWPLG